MTLDRAWTAEQDARLRELYASGTSYSVIADALGVTRSAAIGRGHRLDLPARESPIKPHRPAPIGTTASGCRYPLWPDSSRPTHEYCGDDVTGAGEPYCSRHRAVCWQRVPTATGAPFKFVTTATP